MMSVQSLTNTAWRFLLFSSGFRQQVSKVIKCSSDDTKSWICYRAILTPFHPTHPAKKVIRVSLSESVGLGSYGYCLENICLLRSF